MKAAAAGVPVVGIGKIEDIFAGVGVPRSIHTEGNRDGMRALTELAMEEREGFFSGGLGLVSDAEGASGQQRLDVVRIEFERAVVVRPGTFEVFVAFAGLAADERDFAPGWRCREQSARLFDCVLGFFGTDSTKLVERALVGRGLRRQCV